MRMPECCPAFFQRRILLLPTRELLTPAQRVPFTTVLATLRERARYYILSAIDLQAIRRRRRPANRLGFAVQLCYRRFPGWPFQVDNMVPPLDLLI